MPSSNENLFSEWRTADRKAHLLERALSKASLRALEGHGEAPSSQDRAKAHQLRETADDLFRLAMDEMKSRATALRR